MNTQPKLLTRNGVTTPSLWHRPPSMGLAVAPLGSYKFPRLLISNMAALKMDALVQLCRIEISWMGTSEQVGNDFRLIDVFVPPQRCSSGGTIFNSGNLYEMFMGADGKVQREFFPLIDKMHVWGHSHHRMEVNQSSTDEEQTEQFLSQFQDYFIRVICNKQGHINAAIYMIDREFVVYQPTLIHENPLDGEEEVVIGRDVMYPFDDWAYDTIREQVSGTSFIHQFSDTNEYDELDYYLRKSGKGKI